MTYCLAITVGEGLVFASDSRTNAGPDQVSTYSKMHTFTGPDRQIVLLNAGNLATTQGVVASLKREVKSGGSSLLTVSDMEAAAEHVGTAMREQQAKHGDAVSRAGFSAEASFIVGGQVGQQKPALYLVYPQGNYITTSEQTPYLQIGESKYGKAILDRVIDTGVSLEEAVRCALVSMDSTIRSNATVGPPIEVLAYPRDSQSIGQYALLTEDDPYLLELRRSWNEQILKAFRALPSLIWQNHAEAVHNTQGVGPAPVAGDAPVEQPFDTLGAVPPEASSMPIPPVQPATPAPMASQSQDQNQNAVLPASGRTDDWNGEPGGGQS